MKRATKRRAQFIGGPVRPALRLRYIGPEAPPMDAYDQLQIARLWPPRVADSRAIAQSYKNAERELAVINRGGGFTAAWARAYGQDKS